MYAHFLKCLNPPPPLHDYRHKGVVTIIIIRRLITYSLKLLLIEKNDEDKKNMAVFNVLIISSHYYNFPKFCKYICEWRYIIEKVGVEIVNISSSSIGIDSTYAMSINNCSNFY